MASRERITGQAERLRAAMGGLGCTRSEALAVVVLLAGACAGLVLLWAVTRPTGAVPAAAPALERSPAASVPAPAPTPSAAALVVHVSGHVARPGVHALPAGARVADALDAAGGALAGARLDALNLARTVADGEQVHVPAPDDPAAPAADAPTDSGAWLPDGRLDITRATQEDFEELPGIGPVLASRIITHREEVGGFETIGDLLGVRGIGEKTLAELADLLAP